MDMKGSSTFTGVVEVESAKAYLFVFDFDFDKEWIPKSQCSFEDEGLDIQGQRRGKITISKWLCEINKFEEIVDVVDFIDKGDQK